MPSHRFYCPQLITGLNELPEDEAHHAGSVMRLRPGDSVELLNGRGMVASGVIEQVSRRGVTVQVKQTKNLPFELRHRLTLAVAMSKAHRQGYLVEKCTELGVAAIWPIIAAHSVTQPGEAAVEKWSRRAIEAAKQSGRTWVPTIAPVVSFTEALSCAGQFHVALFSDLDSQATPILRVLESMLHPYLSRELQFARRLSLYEGGDKGGSVGEIIAFVGPEGGWNDEERRTAHDAKTIAVSLSPTVLRAETAAVALCAAVAAISVS